MRRSLAPSQRSSFGSAIRPDESKSTTSSSSTIAGTDDERIIERMPMFGFLSIPNNLQRQFKIPSGCKITSKSIELRKVKSLGLKRNWQPLRPGDLSGFRSSIMDSGEPEMNDEDADLEGLPNSESLPPFERLILWRDESDPTNAVEVVPELASKLRPHQREGVQFLFECTMGLRGFDGNGCILADDMGLGKTLMSITTLWTLLNQGFVKGESAVKKVVVVCPTSLVGNWENEINRWLSGRCIIFAVKSEPKKIIKSFVQHRGKGVLIVSYETQRRYSAMFKPSPLSAQNPCDLLICDEAHKLKNAESGLAVALNELPAKKRILLSGTPMQNELTEFYNMVNFCNPLVLGTLSEFRKNYERPILNSREPGASPSIVEKAAKLQRELSTIVNEFILKRGNILNAQHLPPKLVQYVCCRLSPLQEQLYDTLLSSKNIRHIRDGQVRDALNSIRYLMHICCHPQLILDSYRNKTAGQEPDEELEELVKIIHDAGGLDPRSSSSKSSAATNGMTNRRGQVLGGSSRECVDPELSGKLTVLIRLMQTLRAMKEGDRIVIVSNYTSTLDVIENLCRDCKWPVLRLDGTTGGQKRTKLVAEFNDPGSGAFAFLLSSKAGGCGINLIGGNRLVLFDPDWNPASDKQAAGRIWREGQKKRCYIYRFMSTSSVEEKIIQRQLSKESLQSIVDDKDAVNLIPQNELKSLFIRRKDTRSDTHDTLRCKRCNSVRVLSIPSDSKKFTKAQVEECTEFLLDFIGFVREVTEGHFGLSVDDLTSLCSEIGKDGVLSSLPMFSKRLRKLVSCIQEELDATNASVNILEEFLNRWADFVPLLTATSISPTSEAGQDNSAADDSSEFVPQEGCPDEEDFNKWSHHCSVLTCDDEALRRAVGDSDVVSFLFGLEVNWDLLQARQELKREEEELRKEQQRVELEALNKRRASKLCATSGIADISDDESNGDVFPIISVKRKIPKNSEDGFNDIVTGNEVIPTKRLKRAKNIIIEDDDDDDDGDDDDDDDDDDNMFICSKSDHTHGNVLHDSAMLKTCGTPKQLKVSSPKGSTKSKRKVDVAGEEATTWISDVLEKHDLFSGSDICDAFEALLMCIVNFSVLGPDVWSKETLDELIGISTQCQSKFESFLWKKAEKRVHLRPIFQNGHFSIKKLRSFKVTGVNGLTLRSCIKRIYEYFGADDLPRSVSSILKSCKYTHKYLSVERSSEINLSTSDVDSKENSLQRSNTVDAKRPKEKQHVDVFNEVFSRDVKVYELPWQCSRCTFESSAGTIRCDMCGFKRPRLDLIS